MRQAHIPIGLKITLFTILVVSGLIAGTTVLIYVFNASLFDRLPSLAGIALAAAIAALLTGLILLGLIRQRVDRPLREMIDQIRNAPQNNYLLRIQRDSSDTLGELATAFNNLMGQITTLDAFKLETEQELASAQREVQYKQAVEDKNRHLTLLYDTARTLSDSVDSEDVYQEVLAIVGCMLDYEELVLMLYDTETEQLNVTATYGLERPENLMGMEFALGEGVTGVAIAQRQTIYIPNTNKDERYLYYKGRKPGDVSLMSVPLMRPTGDQIIGALNVSRPVDEPFEQQERETVQAVSHLISMAINNAHLYKQLKNLAVRDELTGLYNRRHGQETLSREIMRARRFSRSFAMLLIDIDHFKKINDRFGHPTGDLILQEFAKLLEASVRDVDYVTRWGGEEFLIILPNTEVEGALTVAKKLRRNVKQYAFASVGLPDPKCQFTVSIGVAGFPYHADNEADCIAFADKALYEAKGAGRDRVLVAESKETEKKVG